MWCKFLIHTNCRQDKDIKILGYFGQIRNKIQKLFFSSLDFEKLCSVSLSRINVYACLVCGKYFQGRGHNTHAYTHSVSDEQHRVFVNLATKKFYCLPDNYEIIDPSLGDIIYVLDPTYTLELINKLETSGKG